MSELERLDAEIARCRNGSGRDESASGPCWMWMLGYADWSIERELLIKEINDGIC